MLKKENTLKTAALLSVLAFNSSAILGKDLGKKLDDFLDDVSNKVEEMAGINGFWQNGCSKNTLSFGSSKKEELFFSPNNDYRKSVTYFSDENCTIPYIEVASKGTYNKNDKENAFSEIDIEIEEETLTPRTQDAVDLLNKTHNQEDWQLNKAGRLDRTTFSNWALGAWSKNIYDVFDITDKKLKFGKASFTNSSKSQPDNRPKSLDDENVYSRGSAREAKDMLNRN